MKSLLGIDVPVRAPPSDDAAERVFEHRRAIRRAAARFCM